MTSRRRTSLVALALGMGALGTGVLRTSDADAQELRFTTTVPGFITATGNTLGLSKQSGANGPGIEDSIGTFISLGTEADLSPVNAANPWFAGTTSDWTLNGSEGSLALGPDAEVLYAELIWGGSNDVVDLVSMTALDGSITLSTANGSLEVTPDNATAITEPTNFAASYYMRSADVTAFVQSQGATTYAVTGVPATQTTSIDSLNAAGWTLVVAVRDEGEPTRNLSVFVGGSFVDEFTVQDYTVSGFCAPPMGVVEGSVVLSTIEGDADLVGDKLEIAQSAVDPFVGLSGPNNPANNFFCSQINDVNGNLDTTGTFGNRNHDAMGNTNVAGGRQGWDITAVPLSSTVGQLSAGQQSAVIRTTTTGDSFMPTLAAFEIDVNSPDFNNGDSSTVVSTTTVTTGDTIVMTTQLENVGDVTAKNVTFRLPLGQGLALSALTMDGNPGDINGNSPTTASVQTGIPAGDIDPSATRVVVATLDITGPPVGPQFNLKPIWVYDFTVCVGDTPLSEQFGGDLAVVQYSDGTGGAGVGGFGGAGGGTGGGIAMGGSGGGDDGDGDGKGTGSGADATGDDGGCGCRVAGQSRGAGTGMLLGLGLIGLLAVRRRRLS